MLHAPRFLPLSKTLHPEAGQSALTSFFPPFSLKLVAHQIGCARMHACKKSTIYRSAAALALSDEVTASQWDAPPTQPFTGTAIRKQVTLELGGKLLLST